MGRNALACLATIGCILAVSLRAPARADEPPSPVRVSVTDSDCDPNVLSVTSGRVTFSIHNATSRAQEWEILDGIMVVEERENIPPGGAETLTAKLAAGDYEITCGLLGNPKGRLHVSARDGEKAKVIATELIGPLAEYRVYASLEIEGLADDTRRLAEALKAGNIASAREIYASAHARYARIAPIDLFFPDLDGFADPQAEKQNPPDPTFMGFRQLGFELFVGGRHDFEPIANKLVDDVAAMQSRFDGLALTPGPTFAGANQTLAGNAMAAIGRTGPSNGADLADLKDYVEGVRKIVDLFQPLIQRIDKRLSADLTSDFASISALLARYPSSDGSSEAAVSFSPEDLSSLQDAMKRLSAEVGRIPQALGAG